MFFAAGVTLVDARREVKAGMGQGVGPKAHMPFTASAKRTLELSLREAMRHRQKYIEAEHIALALIGEPEGRAVTVLAALGADLDVLHEALTEIVERQGDAAQQSARARFVMRATPGGGKAEMRELRLQRDVLAEAVRRYARHEPGCPARPGDCSCGLADVLARLEPESTPGSETVGG